MTKLLVGANANVDAVDEFRETPLHKAARQASMASLVSYAWVGFARVWFESRQQTRWVVEVAGC
jgi:hypothetical protein